MCARWNLTALHLAEAIMVGPRDPSVHEHRFLLLTGHSRLVSTVFAPLWGCAQRRPHGTPTWLDRTQYSEGVPLRWPTVSIF